MAKSKVQLRKERRLRKAVKEGRKLNEKARKEARKLGLIKSERPPKKEEPKKRKKKTIKEIAEDTDTSPVDSFLDILGELPEEDRGRFLSSFRELQKLPKDKQEEFVESFRERAEEETKPKFEREERRLEEDFQFDVGGVGRRKRHLQQTFDKIVEQIDFNMGRDIAKTNKDAASAIQNVTNSAFVTGVAGGGIFKRRTSFVNEAAQNRIEDISVAVQQDISRRRLAKGQAEEGLESELARLEQLHGRDVFDLGVEQFERRENLFTDLVTTDLAKKGYQYGQILESDPTAAVDLLTDEQRRERTREELAGTQTEEALRRAALNPDDPFDVLASAYARGQAKVEKTTPRGGVDFYKVTRDGEVETLSYHQFVEKYGRAPEADAVRSSLSSRAEKLKPFQEQAARADAFNKFVQATRAIELGKLGGMDVSQYRQSLSQYGQDAGQYWQEIMGGKAKGGLLEGVGLLEPGVIRGMTLREAAMKAARRDFRQLHGKTKRIQKEFEKIRL